MPPVPPHPHHRRLLTLRTISRVGSCRFTAYYWLTCALGLYAGGRGTVPWLVFAALFWLVYCLATELLNRITDRAEDAVNRPERTTMCDAVGFRRLSWLAAMFYSLLIALASVWIAFAPTVTLAALLAINIVISYEYSRGLRLKTRRRLGPVALMALVTAPLLTGWATGGDTSGLLDKGVPLLVVVALFFGGLVGIKDITDVVGDLKIGYSSVWVALATSSRRRLPFAVVVALPFGLLLGLVIGGVLPGELAWLVTLGPLSAAVVVAAARASSPEERSVAREAMYHHIALFLAATLVLYDASIASLVTGAVGFSAWVVASRYLHWTRLVTFRSAEIWRALVGNAAMRRTA